MACDARASMLTVTKQEAPMSTHIQPHDDRPDSSAQSLLMWLGAATVIVTGLIVLAVTILGLTAGMFVAYGGLLIAAVAVFAFIMRFIGPEDH